MSWSAVDCDSAQGARRSRAADRDHLSVRGEWRRRHAPPASTALAKPEIREKLLAIGLIPEGSTPEGLGNKLAANTAFWQPIVKATGYKIDN
jgi:hypothetical protein